MCASELSSRDQPAPVPVLISETIVRGEVWGCSGGLSVINHQRAKARGSHDVNRLDDLGTILRIHRRQQATRLYAIFDNSRHQRSLWAIREPMNLLLRQPLDRIPSRCCLGLELLRQCLRELRVSIPFCAVGLRTLTLRPIGRTIRYVYLVSCRLSERSCAPSSSYVAAGVARSYIDSCQNVR